MKYFKLIIVLYIFTRSTVHSQQWDTLAPIPESFGGAVTLVLNGKIHIMGGYKDDNNQAHLLHHYAYDPVTDSWVTKAPVPINAMLAVGSVLDGKIHYIGGRDPQTLALLKAHYIYDPASNTWLKAADLPQSMEPSTAGTANGKLYIVAGTYGLVLYDPASDTWTKKSTLPAPTPYFQFSAFAELNGTFYNFGGSDLTFPSNWAALFDTNIEFWATLPNLPIALSGLAGTTIGNQILLSGGYNQFRRSETYFFDDVAHTYSSGPPLPYPLYAHKMVTVGNCIYVVGGAGNNPADSQRLLRWCPTTSSLQPSKDIIMNAWYESGILHLEVNNDKLTAAQLQVFDLQGRLRYAENIAFTPESHQANIGALEPAVYVLRLSTPSKVYSEKFVVSQ